MPPAIKNDLDQLNAPITLAKQTNFVCPYENCGNTYKRKAKLIEHERVHTGERPFVCTYPGCGKTYRRSTNLSAHTRTHEPEAARPFHCSHEGCTKSFLSLSHLNRHEKTHGVPIFKCTWEGCTEAFTKKFQLRHHMCTHTGKKPFPCTFEGCEKSFATGSKLRRHETIHSDVPQYMCSFSDSCDAKFTKWSALQQHIKVDHPVTCSFCDREFDRQGRLHRHVKRKHIKRDPVPCTWPGCNQTFSSNASMKTHILLVHERNTRYKCNFEGCDKGFPYKSIRDKHEQSHQRIRASPKRTREPEMTITEKLTGYNYAGEGSRRSIPCPFDNCNFKFIRKYDLERHIQGSAHQDDISHMEPMHKKIHVGISDLMNQDNEPQPTETQ